MFWLRMNSEIEEIDSKCSTCMEFRSQRPCEPMILHEIPDHPWSNIGTDLFEIGTENYLILIDYYSKFPEVIRIPNKTAHAVISATKSVFAREGIPDKVISDNGPCYDNQEYKDFAHQWEFHHIKISPGHSQSNGQVENA
uniref:Uncharacterized protein K02A2.6-like n=1 Tax=Saccoglossus kowalevskii TaxID=10224 RepID=A0ABM0M1R1_SACKO